MRLCLLILGLSSGASFAATWAGNPPTVQSEPWICEPLRAVSPELLALAVDQGLLSCAP